MSKWVDNFNSHPIVSVWGNLIELVADEELDKRSTASNVEDLSRLRKVVGLLNAKFDALDPELTPLNQFNNIQSQAQNCFNELNAYKGNGNAGHLANANNHADALIVHFHQLPSLLQESSTEGITSAVSSYSETIGKYISKYKDETDASVNELAARVKQLNSEIETREARLADLNSQLDNVEQTIQQQTSEFNTQYMASEKARSDKFEKELESYTQRTEGNLKSYSDKSDEEFKELTTKTAKIIEVLTTLQDDASKVYGVTINTLQGGAYSSYANTERSAANRYRLLASAFMLLGVAFLIAPEILLFLKEDPYQFDWKKVLGRIPMSLVVFVPAFYFARESGKHRHNEIANRRRQHILTTLDPYIELMEPEKAEELKVHVAKTIFSDVSSPDSTKDETGNLLSQLSNLVKQIKT